MLPLKRLSAPRLCLRRIPLRARLVARATAGSPPEQPGGFSGFFQRMFQGTSSSGSGDEEEEPANVAEDTPSRSSSSSRGAVSPAQSSFSDAEDSALASALSMRIQQMQQASLALPTAAAKEPPLTAEELRALVFQKYGKSYDLTLVRRDIPGKTFVCLNVMWVHLEQKSFKMSEAQYLEKLDSIAYMLNAAGQTELVRRTLQAPPKAQNGMPSRPKVGIAIAINLPVSQDTIDEWFGRQT